VAYHIKFKTIFLILGKIQKWVRLVSYLVKTSPLILSHRIFDTKIRPVYGGDLGSRQKKLNFPIAILYFLALPPTSLKQYFADKK
jgi:hypothetical protein